MRLSNHQNRGSRLELSMTSMIDVVFLLLIFFIVTTTFVRPERQLQSAITVNEKSESSASSELEPAMIKITRVGEQVMFQIGVIQTNDLKEINNVLQDFENKSDGAFVQAAGDVPYEAAAQAIGACKASGFASVSYLTGD